MYAVITHRTCRRGCCPGRRPWCGSGSSSCWSWSRGGPAAGRGRCSGDPFHGAPGLRMKYSVNEGAVQMGYSKDYTNRRWQYLINTLPTASVLKLFRCNWQTKSSKVSKCLGNKCYRGSHWGIICLISLQYSTSKYTDANRSRQYYG